ncbi:hypothetical protein CXF46_09605 [Corynebacterium bovis]|nr:hypothetical protein CXF45_02495 [Corynebacterium bovis]RRQ13895.1 hypothetical protein CXF47_03385 [Corynebacterium bovis]RRQ15171.1 hypothetical protein CXF46_09605 [Corynebacterium bovis]
MRRGRHRDRGQSVTHRSTPRSGRGPSTGHPARPGPVVPPPGPAPVPPAPATRPGAGTVTRWG